MANTRQFGLGRARCQRENLSYGLSALLAILAQPAHFQHRALGGEASLGGGGADAFGQRVVIDMPCRAAIVADQEDAIVQTAGMAVGDEGVGAFDTADQIVGHEKVKDAVHAVGRDAAAARFADQIGDVIGAAGLPKAGDGGKHLRAHFGPLLATLFERGLRGGGEFGATGFVMLMIMFAHSVNLGAMPRLRKAGLVRGALVEIVAKSDDQYADHRRQQFVAAMWQCQCAAHHAEPETANAKRQEKTVCENAANEREQRKADGKDQPALMHPMGLEQAADRRERGKEERGAQAMDQAKAGQTHRQPVDAPALRQPIGGKRSAGKRAGQG